MEIRKVIPNDKERMLSSFKPLFGDWDYLPFVIDEWLSPSADKTTWLVEAGSMLVAMGQAVELEAGDWYLNGLRSNPQASPFEIGCAILGMRRVIRKELVSRGAKRLRYGTLPWNKESLRMGSLFGFREHFRLGHSHHNLPGVPARNKGISVQRPDNPTELFEYLNAALVSVYGYFFTWWDTRRLRPSHLKQAFDSGLLLKAQKGTRMTGAAMCYYIPWQRFLVGSIIEGDDESLNALYCEAVKIARSLNCKSIGLVHPSMNELNRRQVLFGLETAGCETVQLIHRSRNLPNLEEKAMIHNHSLNL
jgi:hypothetical protein